MLEDEECEKAKLEEEIELLQSQLLQISFEADQVTMLDDYFTALLHNWNLDSVTHYTEYTYSRSIFKYQFLSLQSLV